MTHLPIAGLSWYLPHAPAAGLSWYLPSLGVALPSALFAIPAAVMGLLGRRKRK